MYNCTLLGTHSGVRATFYNATGNTSKNEKIRRILCFYTRYLRPSFRMSNEFRVKIIFQVPSSCLLTLTQLSSNWKITRHSTRRDVRVHISILNLRQTRLVVHTFGNQTRDDAKQNANCTAAYDDSTSESSSNRAGKKKAASNGTTLLMQNFNQQCVIFENYRRVYSSRTNSSTMYECVRERNFFNLYFVLAYYEYYYFLPPYTLPRYHTLRVTLAMEKDA